MNFLSHFYFERQNTNDYFVMGVVLPDLVKNAHKDWNLNPQKNEFLYAADPDQYAVLSGWKKHLEVDRLFHNSLFFKEQTANLKQCILPLLNTGPVKPFFLAHIGLELVLDHLLLVENQLDVNTFYTQLSEANTASLDRFLAQAGVPDKLLFDNFLANFISGRYLLSYQKMENISYALNRICMRLWNNPFNEDQLVRLTGQLERFKEHIAHHYLDIFEEIETALKDQE